MYHQQQQGSSFSGGPHPNQPPVRSPGDMMPPPVGAYQFPRPTQLPDELESALSIRGSRDMDHRLIEHLDRLSQLQNQSTAAMGQHGNYGNNPQRKQQSVDWSSYEPPTKLFSNNAPSAAHSGQHPAGHTGTGLSSNWNPSVGESSASNPRGPLGRSFYTPESAGTILASFGLSNEDLEALSHYPDDQLTPDTLPFILRDLQVHKTAKPKTAHSRSPEVPSLLTVTQTEGRVIDYGHASQAKDNSGPPKLFKKEPISSERTVKMYPTPAPKLEASVGRQVRLEPTEPIKHGDRDYRRRSSEHHTSRSPPPREFSAKSRHQDRDYRPEPPKPRPPAEKRSTEPPISKPRPAPNPARPMIKASSSKKLPTPTMISDYFGLPPKVYPHTCSLCDMQCDLEKDWLEHLETVNHTASCRHLRTKYPNWKPKVSSRTAEHKRPAHGHPRSTSWSPPPPSAKPRAPAFKPRGKAYTPQHLSRHHPYRSQDVDSRYERPYSHSVRRPTSRDDWDKSDAPPMASRMYIRKRPFQDSKFQTSFGGQKKPVVKKPKQTKPTPKKVIDKLPRCDPRRLVYLSDIPKEATELEVSNLVKSFGPFNNVLMMPFPNGEDEDQCRQASVCMGTVEDAQALANAPNLLIKDRVITATVPEIPEELQCSDADGSKQETDEPDQIPEKKGVVLIEDLPESGWTVEDLKKLVEPFGYLEDVFVAKEIKKAVLVFPDETVPAEIVKVNTFSPLTITENKLKITQVNGNISINTPVALYNCLMHSLENFPVSHGVPSGTPWALLVMVSNVPSTPSAISVVHKLISRMGTVNRSLVVNNMGRAVTIYFEMATAPLASATCKHYVKFPCVIESNPLFFSHKADFKIWAKVISTFLNADKDMPENKKDAETTPVTSQNETTANSGPEEETRADVEMESEPVPEELVETEASEEVQETTEQATEEAENTEATPEDVKKETPDQPPEREEEAVVKEDDQETAAAPKENGTGVQPAEVKADTTEGAASDPKTSPEVKETKAAPQGQKSQVKPSKKPPAPGKKQASAERSKDPARSSREEERRRRADREAREIEARDKVRRERERIRKEHEQEEQSKRETRSNSRKDEDRRSERKDDRREEMKKEWRREWERREGRRKPYEDRRRGDRRSQYREDRHRSSSRRSTTEEEDFPFNLSDFVTVDEVGDVDSDALIETGPEPGPETGPETGPEPGPEPGPDTETKTQTEERVPDSEPPQEQPQENDEATSMDVATEEEKTTTTDEEVTEVKTEAEEQELTTETETETKTKEANAEVAEVKDEDQATAGDVSDVTEEPCPAAAEESNETNQEEPGPKREDRPEVSAETTEENKEELVKEEDKEEDKEELMEENKEEDKDEPMKEEEPAAETEESVETKAPVTEAATAPPAEKPENGEQSVPESTQRNGSGNSLPPFDPKNPVGLEYLVPMTGFFCKVCTRFFTGAKETQISHSKSLKHYENLEKFLKNRQSSSSSAAESGST